MAERWVVNASPIIVLAQIGMQRLLNELADEIVVPRAVAAEILNGPEDDPARHLLARQQLPISDAVAMRVEIVGWDLGPGESAVLSYALDRPEWTAIIDDAAARRCARSHLISHMGTLAVVIRARQRLLIDSAADVLRQLVATGFRIDDRVVRDALQLTVGEEWPG